MYRPVPRDQITDILVHLRDLFREIKPSNAHEYRTHERREIFTKNFLSNLFRLKEHPTLHAVLEIANIFSLTLDGAHRIFGYDLGGIREYDFRLNCGRTRIVESYPFERDLPVDLPAELGNSGALGWNATLHDLVSAWQTDVPIRELGEEGWHQPGAFYVQVGTEDSLGSSLPPGAIALVEPIHDQDRLYPNPRVIYLLQFGNGYRCSRCVVTRNKLLLLVSGRDYTGPQEFLYPGEVRIAGRVRIFALSLPVPEYPLLRSLPSSSHKGPLILPWEHSSMNSLFTTKYLRFQRSRQDLPYIRDVLESVFHTRLSSRTERRYRQRTSSQPHVDALIQLSLANMARYSDTLRAGQTIVSDRGRFSLDALLNTQHLKDLSGSMHRAHLPIPSDRWAALREKYVEWPTLLSVKFPHLKFLGERVVRLPYGSAIRGLEPSISPGSLVLLEKMPSLPDLRGDAKKIGWGRPIYAFRRGAEIFCGYLQKDGNQYVILSNSQGRQPSIRFRKDDVDQLNRISAIAVPV